ncbi:MAG: hypothetical protein OXF27_02210, partial [Acidobacteria bacterium]|nr:hypothetical protein [Acidobacteriota bacterium]
DWESKAVRLRGVVSIGYGAGGGKARVRLLHRRQLVKPVIGDRRRADVRFVAPESSGRTVGAGAGQETEKGGLTGGWESDEAGSEHICSSLEHSLYFRKANKWRYVLTSSAALSYHLCGFLWAVVELKGAQRKFLSQNR